MPAKAPTKFRNTANLGIKKANADMINVTSVLKKNLLILKLGSNGLSSFFIVRDDSII